MIFCWTHAFFIKNLSSSTSHSLMSCFFILMNVMLFLFYLRDPLIFKVALRKLVKNHFFLDKYILCLKSNLYMNANSIKILMFIKLSMTSKVIGGYIRPLLCQNHSGTFFYEKNLWKFIWMIKFVFLFDQLWPQRLHEVTFYSKIPF